MVHVLTVEIESEDVFLSVDWCIFQDLCLRNHFRSGCVIQRLVLRRTCGVRQVHFSRLVHLRGRSIGQHGPFPPVPRLLLCFAYGGQVAFIHPLLELPDVGCIHILHVPSSHVVGHRMECRVLIVNGERQVVSQFQRSVLELYNDSTIY